jgi:acetyl-CoA C-acetyltransferase
MRKNKCNEEDIVIVSAVRTPFSKFDTAMKNIDSIDLAVIVMKEVIQRIDLKPEEIEEINYGSCIISETALYQNIPARQASILAGFPAETISVTLDRACCSSLTALRMGVRAIRNGELKVAMSVGSDNMPRAPHLAPGLRWAAKIGDFKLEDPLFEAGYKNKGFNPVTVDAGEVALEYGVTRQMQDEWALRSQERYFAADAAGKFEQELTPVAIPQKKGDPIVIEKDEAPRKTSLEALARLSPVYGSPTITAGNAPPLSAGASAIVFMTLSEAQNRGLKPLAQIIDVIAAARTPREIAVVPGQSIAMILERNDLSLDGIKLIEINEAFAAMPLVSTKILAENDEKQWKALQEKTNVNGGAVAIGHPVGASANRITMHLAHELARQGGGYGVAAICGGLAQGEAILIKV